MAVRAEEQLQRSVVQLLAIYEQRGLLAYCHPANGGWRSKAEAGVFKAMGVRAGVPDLLLWTPFGKSFGLELKAGKGTLSDAQVLWRSTLESLGHRVYVCWSVEEVEAVLRLEGVPAVGRIDARAEKLALDAFSGALGSPGRVGGVSLASRVKKSEPA